MVGRLVALSSFDAVTQLAEAYPLKVFPDAVGLPEEGRENLLPSFLARLDTLFVRGVGKWRQNGRISGRSQVYLA